MEDHQFCRRIEKEIRDDYDLVMGDFWTHKTGRMFEVHGPDNFYWSGQAHCAWDARSKAYEVYGPDEDQ